MTSYQEDTPKQDSNQRARTLADSALQKLQEALERGESDALKNYLGAMGRFHDYSWGNVLLIACQRPGATRVAGFHKWHEFDRYVRKGEKGIMILAPIVVRVKKDESNEDKTRERKCVGFRATYVFDVQQTDGQELPEFVTASGDPKEHVANLCAFVASQNIALNYSDDIRPAKGCSMGGKITLLPDLPPAEHFATLVHEIAHELLHRGERRGKDLTKTIRETEAESVAYVVSSAIGLDMSTSSSDYIRLYNGDKDTLTESLAFIQKTANMILEAIMPEETVAA